MMASAQWDAAVACGVVASLALVLTASVPMNSGSSKTQQPQLVAPGTVAGSLHLA